MAFTQRRRQQTAPLRLAQAEELRQLLAGSSSCLPNDRQRVMLDATYGVYGANAAGPLPGGAGARAAPPAVQLIFED